MTDDDLDLSAWDAPPAPANLADRVIDRMQAGAAIMAKVERTRSQRIRLISGVAFGVAAGALGLWLIRPSTRSHKDPVAMNSHPMGGGISVDKPSSIIVGDSRADLAAGARVVWVGNVISQNSGVATWHVGKSETLAIDAGDGVARIEATNANFRIEAKMNLTDVKIIGASATTAAAVALVTVVVYEGHVKVTGAAQQITINAGQGAEVAKDQPPVVTAPPVDHTVAAPSEPLTPIHIDAGESATIHEPDDGRTVRVYIDRICGEGDPEHQIITAQPGSKKYTATCVPTGATHEGTITLVHDTGEKFASLTTPSGPWGDDLDLTVKIAGRAYTTKAKQLTPDYDFHTAPDQYARVGDTIAVRLDAREGIQFVLVHPTSEAQHARDASALRPTLATAKAFAACTAYQPLQLTLDIAPSGMVTGARATAKDPNDASLECFVTVGKSLRFPQGDQTTVTWPFNPSPRVEKLKKEAEQHTIAVSAELCKNPDHFVDEGTLAEAKGDHKDALAGYEKALACKPGDKHSMQLAFMAACNGGNKTAARRWYQALDPGARSRLKTMCYRNHIGDQDLE
ncbi:MAG: hypothetical protein QM831_23500 [Kofleriaceae bacterium]